MWAPGSGSRGDGGLPQAAVEEEEALESEVCVEALAGTGWMGQVNGGFSKCHGVLYKTKHQVVS